MAVPSVRSVKPARTQIPLVLTHVYCVIMALFKMKPMQRNVICVPMVLSLMFKVLFRVLIVHLVGMSTPPANRFVLRVRRVVSKTRRDKQSVADASLAVTLTSHPCLFAPLVIRVDLKMNLKRKIANLVLLDLLAIESALFPVLVVQKAITVMLVQSFALPVILGSSRTKVGNLLV
jgi:hypothetical protein